MAALEFRPLWDAETQPSRLAGEDLQGAGRGLELVERRWLRPGDFYVLLLPRDDIHRLRTTPAETSDSIHLRTNDTGCVWRHTFDLASGAPEPFRAADWWPVVD